MRTKKNSRVFLFLISLLVMFAALHITADANEYFDINNLTDNASFVLGSEVSFSVTPKKHVASKWSSWSNYPNYIYVRVYKENETEPYESRTYMYNRDGSNVGDVMHFMMPEAVGVERTMSFTPDAVGTYTVKMLWQNYDDKYKKVEPALTDQYTFTVTEAEEPSTEAPETGVSGTPSVDAADGKTAVSKKVNPITVKGKTVTVSCSKLKKKNVTVAAKKAFSVKKAKGKVTYKKLSGSGKITVSKAGKITVKKKLKKGKYKISVKVTAAGNEIYKKKSGKVSVVIVVK